MLAYQERSPDPRLRAVIRCYWFLALAHSDEPGEQRIVPDGCPEIVINRAAPLLAPSERRSGVDGGPIPVVLAGQLRGPLFLRPTGDIDLVGIRFQPSGLPAILGPLPIAELNDERVRLVDLERDLAHNLAASVERAGPSAANVAAALDQALLTAGAAARTTPRDWLATAIDCVEQSSILPTSEARIEQLGTRFGISARTLQREFRRRVGLSPKAFARLSRFQRVYRTLEHDPSGCAGIALDCGYYDQAHLIRDFGRFAGRSPRRDFGDEVLARLFCRGNGSPDHPDPSHFAAPTPMGNEAP